jgi:nucleotide-binding universal stress UspA family protein
MNTVLCATDLLEDQQCPSEEAAAMASALGCNLELLHVIELPPVFDTELMLAAAGGAREAAERDLAARADALARWKVPVTTRVELGRTEDVILARTKHLEPSLLVVGTHARRGASKLLLGSVAERTVRTAPCPVMVVPQSSVLATRWAPGRRPLVVTAAIDFSPASRAALQWLGRLRQATASELHVVHLYWPPRESARLGIEDPEAESTRRETVEVLERELKVRLNELPGQGPLVVRARPQWGVEPDAFGWEVESDDADLLVMGTSQERHSTAIASIRTSKVPVVCVPASSGASEQPLPRRIAHALVPTDFSAPASAAVTEALRLLPPGGLLTLCHVAPRSELGLSPQARFEIETALLGLMPARAGGSGIRCRTQVQESDTPGEAIVQIARRVGADVIVMAPRGRSGLRRALLGSVADAVVGRSPVPVTLVPSAEQAQR